MIRISRRPPNCLRRHASGGALVDALPAKAQPLTFADAAAIQQALLGLLGETAAGYKVAGTTPETVMWGAIL